MNVEGSAGPLVRTNGHYPQTQATSGLAFSIRARRFGVLSAFHSIQGSL
ncbi:hypothetical protein IMCC3088_649 [Aequoribacter fuscus]|uniref:Uncharacterized protein n=1 Tax=Aequoribacter fuscus TaxID=2518989 RepID=F3L612_9GAMM|nr:hypothetical protein IMCC3088_649 [Aequoribacter fuscus]